jgi:hypothetical protein
VDDAVVAGATKELYSLLERLITLALVNGDVFLITFLSPILILNSIASLMIQLRRKIKFKRSCLIASVLEDMRNTTLQSDLQQLGIIFSGEPGIDEGGLRREFFQLLAEELCDPSRNLLAIADDGRYEVVAGAEIDLYALLVKS